MIYTKRVLWADLLKIFSIYGVITIHSSAPLLITYDSTSFAWWIGNIYNSISRWCIPVFFMLSGIFILEQAQRDSLRQFYSKRFKRIMVPFIMWSAIYFLWRIFVNKEELSIKELLWLFIEEPAYYHLWFIYTLIGLYLLSPFMGKYLKHAGKWNLVGFILLWFIFGSLIPTLELLFNMETYLSIKTPSQIFYYSGNFMLGYVLKNVRINGRGLFFSCALFMLTFFFTAYGTYYLTVRLKNGPLVDILYNYYSVNVFLMSLSVFLFARNINFLQNCAAHKMLQKIIYSVAASIPGIYLIHAMVISSIKGGLLPFTFTETMFNPVVGIPLFSSVIFIVSFCLVYVIKQIPGSNYLIP